MPHTEYYDLLGVSPTCPDKELKRAYRQQALQWHPDKHTEPAAKEAAAQRFKKIAHAYEVLSDPEKRRMYDVYGEKMEERAAPEEHRGPRHPNAAFYGEGADIFQQFFGTAQGLYKSDPIFVDVWCTLRELYFGCRKIVTVKRQLSVMDLMTTDEEVDFDVEVKRGWKAGTRSIWEGHGHHWPGSAPGDIIFVIRELQHPKFQRKGNDLYYDIRVAVGGGFPIVEITLLDDTPIIVCDGNQFISPGMERIVPNKGMPLSRHGEYGDLIVRFDTWLPRSCRWPWLIQALSLLETAQLHKRQVVLPAVGLGLALFIASLLPRPRAPETKLPALRGPAVATGLLPTLRILCPGAELGLDDLVFTLHMLWWLFSP
eukprot:GGOE01061593.1.p2 GENE.GGOE01061593.1~~GGOE01061593.1.p2  ORF type:complete len:384 (-),score=117.53 GGOE01061593.1:133-1245(-)